MKCKFSPIKMGLIFGFLFLGLLSLSLTTWAQSTTDGAIGGTIYDASGAVLANARITVHNDATGSDQSLTTDESGYFRAIHLQPGVYTVTVVATGFSTYKAEQVIVQVGGVTELSPRLQVGVATTTVSVTAETPQINLTSADFAPTMNQVAIDNLPINGGRWSNFVLLTPGVVNDSSGFGLVSFRGISTLLNNNTVDGADNNQAFFSEERGRTRAGYSTAKVAIQEFQVNTSNYSAEYGRSAGGVVNTVTKSGTNQMHGEVYLYDRDNTWGSTNPFTTLTTQSSPGVFTAAPFKPQDIRTMWGFGVGGAIIKDKLFWFLAYDGYHHNFPGVASATSPGAFFATPSAATISTLAGRLGVSNPVAQTDYTNGLNGLLGEIGSVPRKGDQSIIFPKIDWMINSKNHASISVNRMRWNSPAGIQTQSSVTFGVASFGNDYVKDTWGVGKLDTFITANLSNEARYQYGRDFEFENNQAPTAYELANFVNPPGYTNPLGLPPDVFITNGFDMGVPTFLERPKYPDERRQQFADTVTWIHGKHSIKFGGDFTHVHDDTQNLRFQYGSFSYSSLLNYFSDFYKPNSCTVSSSNLTPAPCYSSYNQAFGPLGFSLSTNDFAFFAQDDWKIFPRLTLSIGLRYEDELMPSPFSALVNPAVPQTAKIPGDNNNFGPRVGFAWDVFGNGRTSLRGGYGMYYGRVINSTIYNALINTGIAGGQFQFTFNATTAGAPKFPQILTTQPVSTIRPNIVFFDPHFQAPQVHEVDLSLERELGWNTVFSVSYLGSFGRELPDFVDTNLAAPTSSVTYTVVDTTGGKGPLKGPTYTTPLFTVRPNANFGSMTDIFSAVNSNYNALALQLNHRLARHIQFNANYTWSHALDFGQNATTFSDTNDLLVPGNMHLEYGNSIFNVPSRFVFAGVIQVPSHASGWMKYFVDGWQLSPMYQAQSGLPYSLVTSGTAPGSVSPGGGGINGSNGRKGIDVLGRNTFHLPRTQVVDLRISKEFTFYEKYRLELLGEAFNLFNHMNITSANNTGYVISTSNITLPGGGTQVCSSAAPCLNFNANSSTFAPVFGVPTNGNSNFAYTARQLQVAVRFHF